MFKALLAICVTVGLDLSLASSSQCAQDATPPPRVEVALVTLAPPMYPPLARTTRISGDVEVAVTVRQDGSVESATLVKGHPLLAPAALDSAKQSRFSCTNCGKGMLSYRMVYSFAFSAKGVCPDDKTTAAAQPPARVSQIDNRVTVVQQPWLICDPVVTTTKIKTRSAKCLYLWKCGTRTVYLE